MGDEDTGILGNAGLCLQSRPSCWPHTGLLKPRCNLRAGHRGVCAGRLPSPPKCSILGQGCQPQPCALGSLSVLCISEARAQHGWWPEEPVALSPTLSRLAQSDSRGPMPFLDTLEAAEEVQLWFSSEGRSSSREPPWGCQGHSRVRREIGGQPIRPAKCCQNQGQASRGVSSGFQGCRSRCRCSETAPQDSRGGAAPERWQ